MGDCPMYRDAVYLINDIDNLQGFSHATILRHQFVKSDLKCLEAGGIAAGVAVGNTRSLRRIGSATAADAVEASVRVTACVCLLL